ncbi:hypothetical protein FH063_000222 [Azospirillum argentinense]|uniref:Uncharacterized protein n=1 Tax=Azospirillum argentinense TaxID=2970906 RepID=A0A5B0KZF7_9PROT|nr:hypothetical protein FH063_000222 [Azospirillum argentinense]
MSEPSHFSPVSVHTTLFVKEHDKGIRRNRTANGRLIAARYTLRTFKKTCNHQRNSDAKGSFPASATA